MFQLREDAGAVGRGRGDVGLAFKGLDCSLLGVGEVFGDVDHDVDKLVASSAVLLVGQTLATQTQHLAGLCAGISSIRL